ncbi:MAG: rod shape-determining protein RodA, partial [Bacteroidales bacterium]
MKQQFFYDFKNFDKLSVFIFLLMVFLGWLNIFAVGYKGDYQSIFDLSQNYGKQIIWIIIALVIGFAALLLDVKLLLSFAYPIYVISLILLIAVLFFGTEINASKSWFQIGGFSIQPSELVKFSTAIVLGKYISNNKHKPLTFKIRIKPFIMLFIPFALILLQNDMGTALVFSAFILVLYREGYISGSLMILFASAIVLFIFTLIFNEFFIIGGLAIAAILTAIFLRKKQKEIMLVILLFFITSAYVYSVNYTFENFLQKHQKNRIEVLIDSS